MRTIRFRAKQTYNNEWVIGNLIYKEAPKRVLENKEPYRNYYIQSQDFTGNLYEVIPETIGQFTGFYDKNGVEIYEGDISKSKNGTPKEWTFVEGCFCINNDYEYLLFNQRHINQIEFEIIGNIHENPELLEK